MDVSTRKMIAVCETGAKYQIVDDLDNVYMKNQEFAWIWREDN